MNLRTLIVAAVLLILPSIGNTQQPPEGGIDIPGVPGVKLLKVDPKVVTEIPFYALIQMPANLDAFWYKAGKGETRLCVRFPMPTSPTTLGFAGNCFTLEELGKFPTLTQPALEPEVAPEDES
jgi:hypothetical protein